MKREASDKLDLQRSKVRKYTPTPGPSRKIVGTKPLKSPKNPLSIRSARKIVEYVAFVVDSICLVRKSSTGDTIAAFREPAMAPDKNTD